MWRALAPLALALGPPGAALALVWHADRDWHQCIGAGPKPWPIGPAEWAALALLVLMTVLPWAALALVWLRRQPRGRVLAIWGVMCLLLLWALLPPDAWHDCDRKGADAALLLMVAPIPMWLALLVALFLTRPKVAAP